jgi:histidinol-phosphate aminotransferase
MSIKSLARPEILAMKPYSSARLEASARGILLNANEMPESMLETGRSFPADSEINRYPQPQPTEIIESFARIYGVPEDRVLVTRGSDEGIDLLVRVFCRAGEDAILECPPGFGMYRIAAQTQGAIILRAPRSADSDFRLDTDRIVAILREERHLKLVFLTSPNNPTGDLIDRDDLLRILREAEGKSLVVLDEAYVEFCPESSAVDLLDEFDHLVILRTMSKAWAAAGLRCGAVLANPEVISLLRRIIAPYPLAGPVIDRVRALLDPKIIERQRSALARVLENKDILRQELESLPYLLNVWPGAANFVLIRLHGAKELHQYCASNGVLIRYFPSDPSLENCIRISVGNRDEMTALVDLMKQWKRPQNGS